MKRIAALVVVGTVLLTCIPASLSLAQSLEELGIDNQVEEKRLARRFFVDCTRGAKLSTALQRAKIFDRSEIMFKGTCEETVVVDQDNMTLRGVSTNPVLVGRVEIQGASNIVIKDFTVRGVPGQTLDPTIGALNITEGAAVSISNMLFEDLHIRGVRAIASSVTMEDVTGRSIEAGCFVFRGSNIVFRGDIKGSDTFFGMSLVYSNAFARNVNFDFSDARFGILIQLNSVLEHVEGYMRVENNRIGMGLAGQGVYAFGTRIEAMNNTGFGIFMDELSSITPLLGAPGEGPSITVTDNDNIGVSVTRGSTIEFFEPTTVSGNAIGLSSQESTVVITDSTISDNTTNMLLGFGSRTTINGDGNTIGQPVECDSTALIQGALNCQAASSPALNELSGEISGVLKMLHQTR